MLCLSKSEDDKSITRDAPKMGLLNLKIPIDKPALLCYTKITKRKKKEKSKMTKELKCPKCGGTHIKEDDYDYITHAGNNNTIKEPIYGHCEDCGIDLQWERIYQFTGYDDIEEVV